MGKKLISIIVPVYNAEKTIERCIYSLCTMPEYVEVICVDDGSVDQSGKIIDKISEKVPGIIVVHQENKGAAAARNTGLNLASGAYIMFCDADDEYHEDALSYIIDDIKKDRPDYIVFSREQHLLDGGVIRHAMGHSKCKLNCSWEDYFNNILQEHGHCVSVINKVYRRQIIQDNGVSFDEELHFGEDLWFNLNYIPHVNYFIEDFRAIYVQHSTEGSLCTSRNDNFYFLNKKSIMKYRLLFPERAGRIDIYFNKFIFISGVIAIRRNLRIQKEYKRMEKKELFDLILKDQDFERSIEYVSHMDTVENTKGMKKEALWLLRGGLLGYSLRYYQYPRLKRFIKSVVCHIGVFNER